MGAAIAEGLMGAGQQVVVYNRTREKCEPLAKLGATVCESAGEAISISDYTISALFDAASTRSVLLNDEETRKSLSEKKLISIAATTPEEIKELSQQVTSAGGNLAEGIVIAYPEEVRKRQSEFIFACDSHLVKEWTDVLSNLGTKIYPVGEVGNSAKAQMSMWLSYMFLNTALAYSLAAFEKLNLPVDILTKVLSSNEALMIAQANSILPEMSSRKYGSDRWSIENMAASIEQATDFAASLGLDTTILDEIKRGYVRASELGLGDKDITALYEVINPNS